MTVRKKLILNAGLTAAGIALILAVSVFATLGIRSSVNALVGRSTPLQVKTMELQQLVEKISADLMRLSLSGDEKDIKGVSGGIEKALGDIERVNGEIRSLNSQARDEGGDVFKGIYGEVERTVRLKVKNIALFRTETERVNESFGRVEGALSAINDNIANLNLSAKGVVQNAQTSNSALNRNIKKLQALQLRLKDVKLALAEVDAVQNKYKLTPIRERIKATMGSVQSVAYAEGDAAIIKDAKAALLDAGETLIRDGSGLIALKSASFGDPAAGERYQPARDGVAASLESINSKTTEYIDGFEIDILKEKENMDGSLEVQGTAETVSVVGHAVGLKVKELNSMVRRVMLSQSEAELDEVAKAIKDAEAKTSAGIKRLGSIFKRIGQEGMLENSSQMLQTMETVGASIDKIVLAKREVLSSDRAMEKAIATIKEVSASQSAEGQRQVETIAQKQKAVVAGVNRTVTLSLTVMVVASIAVFLSLAVATGKVTMSIVRPLKATEEMITAVERGDLTRKMDVATDDELGRMCRAFDGLVDRLHAAIAGIHEKSNEINSSAVSVASAVEQQAAFSSELSSSMSEISATMEELAASSNMIAENAGSVVKTAEGSLGKTHEGAQAVETVRNKLNEIHSDNQTGITEIVELGRKSKEISKVMEIINTIADQTKLIAFNAALEASSAGEAGRRFGVVAVEIRRLADSVMESTGEIEAKINEIQEAINRLVVSSEKGSKGIQEGLEFSGQTTSLLSEMVSNAESTTGAAKQISLSTQQQKTASGQVVAALRDIVGGAEQTALSIKQISDISRDLSALSSGLKELVGGFRLRENATEEEERGGGMA